MSFKLPKSLYPVHQKDGDFFNVPNVATGSIQLKDSDPIPVFSAFFSHATFLPPKQWQLIKHPVKGEDGKTTTKHVFVDPATLYVLGKSVIAFYTDDEVYSGAVAGLHLYAPDEPEHEEISAVKPWTAHPKHWRGVGGRYKEVYELLGTAAAKKNEKKTAKAEQEELSKLVDKLEIV